VGVWAIVQDCRSDKTTQFEVSHPYIFIRSGLIWGRNVSAEIFVVCREFLAPKHIDPKFLDPKHVFKDVSSLPTSITEDPSNPSTSTVATAPGSKLHSNVFMPEKKRRNREGYADGDYTLFHKTGVSDFVKGQDPVALLGTNNKIEFITDEEKE
jgi:AdoMet-dependent rRNA methyltransferase SPB1